MKCPQIVEISNEIIGFFESSLPVFPAGYHWQTWPISLLKSSTFKVPSMKRPQIVEIFWRNTPKSPSKAVCQSLTAGYCWQTWVILLLMPSTFIVQNLERPQLVEIFYENVQFFKCRLPAFTSGIPMADWPHFLPFAKHFRHAKYDVSSNCWKCLWKRAIFRDRLPVLCQLATTGRLGLFNTFYQILSTCKMRRVLKLLKFSLQKCKFSRPSASTLPTG